MGTNRPVITGRKGVITTGHYLATAAGFALSVLKPHQNSLGGECQTLIYSPSTGEVAAVSGQGTAPRKADMTRFKQNNIGLIPGISGVASSKESGQAYTMGW